MPRTGLERLRTLTRVLDDLVRIPGTRIRIGLDPIIGLLPGVGDATGAALSAYSLLTAVRLGAPPVVLLRMAGNIALDAIVGTVPFLGDLFDFTWKANRRNLALIERYELAPASVVHASRMLVVALIVALVALVVGTALLGYVFVRWLASAGGGGLGL